MLKSISLLKYITVFVLLLLAFFIARFVYDYGMSVALQIPVSGTLASYKQFHVIQHNLSEMEDLREECKKQLGENVRIADWNDILKYYNDGGSIEDFIKGLKMTIREDRMESGELEKLKAQGYLGNEYRITYDNKLRWQGRRHYFVGRHDYIKPPGFLDHANLDNYHLTVGSWFGTGGYALCYGKVGASLIDFNSLLRTVTKLSSILFVGILLLIAVLISMQILNKKREL
ncbi:hypothetical protein JT359_12815 [Candidatus Poribacteria bacterium]|nr:hypothetical protein [Candidatus Poribacteria bacterium]